MAASSPMKKIFTPLWVILVAAMLYPPNLMFLMNQVTMSTPFDVCNSKLYVSLAEWARRGPPIAADSMPEIDARSPDFSQKRLEEITEKYTKPVIIRNMLNEVPSLDWEKLSRKEHDDFLICIDMANPNRMFECTAMDVIHSKRNNTEIKGIATKGLVYGNEELLDLVKDLPVEDWIVEPSFEDPYWYSMSGAPIGGVHSIFLAPAGTATSLHGELGLNFIKQVSGAKRWTLFDYYHWPNLQIAQDPALFGGVGTPVGESVLPHTPWITQVPRFEGTTQPGDAILVPTWWAHLVENVDPEGWTGEPNTSISVGMPQQFHTMSQWTMHQRGLGRSLLFTVNMLACNVASRIKTKISSLLTGDVEKSFHDVNPTDASAWTGEAGRQSDRHKIRASMSTYLGPRQSSYWVTRPKGPALFGLK